MKEDIFDIKPPNGYSFRNVGSPVDPELRPIWRLSLICIILSKLSRSNRATIKKIQILCSIMSSERRMRLLEQYSVSEVDLEIRLDPLTDKAILLGIDESLLKLIDGEKVELSDAGRKLSDLIFSDESIMTKEKNFISLHKPNDFSESKTSNYFSS